VDRPLRRTTLRDQIKDRIVERILNGTYGPGDRIVESQVATEFGTSQAPVREALRELEALRFVEARPHRGARVRESPPRSSARSTRYVPPSKRLRGGRPRCGCQRSSYPISA
jgi:DNA-binding GntR family transcriptional regulator